MARLRHLSRLIDTDDNGSDCLEKAKAGLVGPNGHLYCLVLMDLSMPIMDGYELVKNIKSNVKLDHVPVIALTSFTEEENQEKAIAAGFDGYAMKTNKENILRAVETFLVEE